MKIKAEAEWEITRAAESIDKSGFIKRIAKHSAFRRLLRSAFKQLEILPSQTMIPLNVKMEDIEKFFFNQGFVIVVNVLSRQDICDGLAYKEKLVLEMDTDKDLFIRELSLSGYFTP